MILLIQKSNFAETGPWTDIKVPDLDPLASGKAFRTAEKVSTVEQFADRVRDAKLDGMYRVVANGDRYIVEVKKVENYESTIRLESK